jgi:hypothetical protein
VILDINRTNRVARWLDVNNHSLTREPLATPYEFCAEIDKVSRESRPRNLRANGSPLVDLSSLGSLE